jgi:putative oxidoreductase
MKYAIMLARLLLALIFVVFGLNAFLHFIKMPPPEGQAGAFMGALFTSGYFYVIAILQVVGGLLLLSGRSTPLGLVLLGPVIVNIVLFHIFLAPAGVAPAVIVSVLALFLLWAYRQRFAPLVKA